MRLHRERNGVESIRKSWQIYKHCTQQDVYGTTQTCGIKIRPDLYAIKCHI